MMQGTETRLDGTMLVIRILMRFHGRGLRKRIVARDGSENRAEQQATGRRRAGQSARLCAALAQSR
jgi:hypothetical protein